MKTSPKSSLTVLRTGREISVVVAGLADEITRSYAGKCPLVIGVLKGAFVFMADLVRHLNFPLEIDFIRLSSYGSGRESSGKVKVIQDIRASIKGRDVLVVEDIVDTGHSISFLMEYLQKKGPASLKLCCLMDKPLRRRVVVPIDYVGFTVPDKFLVGYGLDCAEEYRNLPDVCILGEDSQ
ncbi:MAG: hypoxanthine phosphoribosyltransferase [Dehalococcoidales bacterium]|nr:hypoxanthine phosphoribosyltransferase [Dehalococcoidales bacterium]